MAIDKTAFPVYQKMHQMQLYHIQKAFNEELRRLESLDIIGKIRVHKIGSLMLLPLPNPMER